jgi:hypothetical protein
MTNPSVWIKTDEFILSYDRSYDEVFVGIEDVRLLCSYSNTLYYSSNRAIKRHNMVIEYGKIDLDKESTDVPCSLLHNSKSNSPIEKNWVLFEDDNNAIKCIYKWFPLQIGDIVGSLWNQTHEYEMPYIFKMVRGSTNGVLVGDELWFINHAVSYEDRRYYYHMMVVLDRHTYQLKRYTPLWTFSGKTVEYTLGFVYNRVADHFLIGYSVFDRETHYIQVPKCTFDDQFIIINQ